MTDDTKSKLYNAVAVACGGDYAAIEKLHRTHGSWHDCWRYFTDRKPPTLDIEAEWERLRRHGVAIILRDDPRFPPLLREIPCAPFGLYVRGVPPAASAPPAVALVGTRRATDDGRRTAGLLAEDFCRQGCVIVSGLAFGIDAAAHRGAIAAGGVTIAVLARGLDEVYPAQHSGLAEKILSGGGCLLTEYPLGSPSYPTRFLERNRIISGLSRATVVIEAPERSGALTTAYFTLEQNRLLFAVPGPMAHSHYRGSHRLIQSGASLVTGAADVTNALVAQGVLAPPRPVSDPASNGLRQTTPEDDCSKAIVAALQRAGAPLTIDRIAALTTLTPSAVHRSLSLLIISNRVYESGGMYAIVNHR